MKQIIKGIITLFFVISFICVPCMPAFAAYETSVDEPTTESMMGDAIVARPLGLISTVVGSAFFVVSLPFSALGGNTREAAEKMVVAPAKFTFKRPLGQF